jgi:transcriptional regulator with PAS, ATPase and Fis domain
MIDFRLISATNASIDEMITQKSFREDLFYRLRTVEINLPPLRERPEDVPELASSFIDQFSKKYNKTGLHVDPAVFKKLSRYHWPGNIRELQHQVEKAVILNDSGTLAESDFDFSRVTDLRKRAETLNLEENEKQLILKAIKKFDGNLTKAANELGINRSTLYEKIKKYEIKQI